MPVDGLGSDAGRQSLTEVGAGGARATRAHARPGRAALVAQRRAPVDAEPLLTPHSPEPPARPLRSGLRGERLVAICALAVLAFAALFFVERIGGLRGAPAPVPQVAPALELPATGRDEPTGEGAAAPSPITSAASPLRAARAAPNSRQKPAPLAAMRKPEGKSPRHAEPRPIAPSEPLVVASADAAFFADPDRVHWVRMHDEVVACAGRAYFHDAVLCDQRVRQRYCDDRWGRAPDCPSGRQADYGN